MHTNHSTTVDTDTDDPATIAFAAMTKQAERFGYLVAVWPGDPAFAAPVEVDPTRQVCRPSGLGSAGMRSSTSTGCASG